MKKVFSIILASLLVLSIVAYGLLGVDFNYGTDVEILRVYSWEEYISQGTTFDSMEEYENAIKTGLDEDEYVDVISLFEAYCRDTLHKNVKVEYSTFGTCENMYNELNLSKKTVGEVSYSYDLVCPSEYMLMKMIKEGMLEKIDKSQIPNYYKYASPYIQDLFQNLKVEGTNEYVSDYSASYMWGTMGYVYNPDLVSEEDAKHWSLVWNDSYQGKSTIKDSVRDSYILAVGYAYYDDLMALKNRYDNNEIDTKTYNAELTAIFNNTSQEAVDKVGSVLNELRPKLYGYEVDSGKKDMAQGKILINFAWSGDAVYTMDYAEGAYDEIAEEDIKYLNYTVPEEGSNVWFDGWVMPKGANTELAYEFINFLSRPEIAVYNMSYIGYTSAIAGDEVFNNAIDWYGYSKDDVTKIGEKYYADCEGEQVEVVPVDLTYYFSNISEELKEDGKAIIYTEEENIGRQFTAQYPTEDIINRCAVMKTFDNEELRRINNMWEDAKVGDFNLLLVLLIILGVILVIVGICIIIKLYKQGKIFQPKPPKGYTLIEK